MDGELYDQIPLPLHRIKFHTLLIGLDSLYADCIWATFFK
jgi:hypothetical protein